MDLKIENGNETINNEFSDFKVGSKVRMNYFKVEMSRVYYLWLSRGNHRLVEIMKPKSNVMLICLEAKVHGCKFHLCVNC